MISLHRSMHSSQMYTPGPAISFFTWRWDLPQKLHNSCSLESVGLAISRPRRVLLPDLVLVDHTVDDAVLLRLLGAHEVVAVGVFAHRVELLVRVLGDDLVQAPAHVDDLFGVDLDVRRLSFKAR